MNSPHRKLNELRRQNQKSFTNSDLLQALKKKGTCGESGFQAQETFMSASQCIPLLVSPQGPSFLSSLICKDCVVKGRLDLNDPTVPGSKGLKMSSLRVGRKVSILSQVSLHSLDSVPASVWNMPAVSITSSMFFRFSGIASDCGQQQQFAMVKLHFLFFTVTDGNIIPAILKNAYTYMCNHYKPIWKQILQVFFSSMDELTGCLRRDSILCKHSCTLVLKFQIWHCHYKKYNPPYHKLYLQKEKSAALQHGSLAEWGVFSSSFLYIEIQSPNSIAALLGFIFRPVTKQQPITKVNKLHANFSTCQPGLVRYWDQLQVLLSNEELC